jgi:glycosyltransferase involved in cell wall biosynthesis
MYPESCTSPLVSIVVPAFNVELFIHETLESLINQTYRAIEILVVDDGSTDGTVEHAESLARKDPRISIIQQKNQGVVAARNAGLALARGEFVSFIDGDDIWYPEKVAKQVERFQSLPAEYGLVYTWSTAISDDSRLLGASNAGQFEGHVFAAMLYRNFIGNGSVAMMRRECLERVGPFDPKFTRVTQGCEDWDLLLRIAEQFKYAVVPEFLVGYRQVNGSVSSNAGRMWTSFQLLMERMIRTHPEIPPRIFNWSTSYFCCWLMCKAYMAGDLAGTLTNLYRAVRADVWVAAVPLFRELGLKAMLRLAARPLTSLIWPTRQQWLAWKKKAGLAKRSGHEPTMSEIIEELQKTEKRKDFYWKVMARRDKEAATIIF